MSKYFAHESNYIDDDVTIGNNTKIWHFSHILSNTTIGKNCSFGQNCVVGPKVKIGNGVKVQNNISIYEGVEIDEVLNKTNFIMGEPIKTLEKNLEKFTGAKHAITCSSGTDALLLAMMALDIKPDDEIITTPKDLKLRQEVVQKYNDKLKDTQTIPFIQDDITSAYAQYSIRVQNRDEVQIRLKEKGIPTAIHYPMPLHLQECFEYLRYVKGDFPISEIVSDEIMSLPMNSYLSDKEIEY